MAESYYIIVQANDRESVEMIDKMLPGTILNLDFIAIRSDKLIKNNSVGKGQLIVTLRKKPTIVKK